MMELLLRLDTALFYFLNVRIANPVFDWLMPIITNQWFWALPILIIWLGMLIFGNKRSRLAALLLILAVATSDPVCYRIIKPTVKRIRPSHQFQDARLLVGKGGRYSFPSNHAANIAAAMTILSFFFRRYKYWFAGIVILVSFSRIYVGVHFPLDVLAGMLLGVLFSLMWLSIWLCTANHMAKRGKYFLVLSNE